jgi:NAD(P)-dependent dehydrogenase (short-subunit alcohol dehydrogenase family)
MAWLLLLLEGELVSALYGLTVYKDLIHQGLGAIMAKTLEANGATVYVVGRRKNKLDEVVSSAKHGRIHALQCDVTSKESLKSVADHIQKEVGYVNLVIANSGVLGPNSDVLKKQDLTLEEAQEELWKVDTEEFNKVYNVNITAVHYTAVAFLHLLDAGNKKGNLTQTSQVIITTSIGAFNRWFPFTSLPYVTSKAAATHMTKALSSFLIKWDIRVNAIAPGGKHMHCFQ